jgi:3-oxoacyl-[acyl-carrier-protein] synthase-3
VNAAGPRPASAGRGAVVGVRIAGTGSCVPSKVLTNQDLEKIMDTSDEWIVQRTGIHSRRLCDIEKGETNRVLCARALKGALDMARMKASDLDLIIVATCTGESTVPSVACRVAALLDAGKAGAFDVVAACTGFVYASTIAHDLVRAGAYRSIGVVGCDTLSSIMDYQNRGVAILFGDGAGAAVLRATDDLSKGLVASALHADGAGWPDLYLPRHERELPPGVHLGENPGDVRLHALQMNGRQVYKFAVSTFCDLIQETLDKAGVKVADVDQFVCHQSNLRILESARERFGIPREKMHINIDHYGNTSAGSVPLVLDDLNQAGKIREGELVLLVAFGAGLTWASGLWRI